MKAQDDLIHIGGETPIRFDNPDLQKILEESKDVKLPSSVERVRLIRCPVCHSTYPEFLKDEPDRCRCQRAKLTSEAELEQIDPYGTMKIQGMRGGPEELGRSISVTMYCIHHDRKQGMLMSGPPGVGKTHVLVGACREALQAGRLAIWKNFVSLVSQIQGSYSDYEGPDRAQIIEDLAKHEIVLLDDIGKERQSDDVASIVYEVIDALYRRRRTLLCATNLSDAELGRRYDLAVLDRLRHMCEFIELRGESKRGGEGY